MKRWARVLLGTLGLAAAVYSTASLTGGWLGTPPWWKSWVPYIKSDFILHFPPRESEEVRAWFRAGELRDAADGGVEHLELSDGREAVSVAVGTLGLALFAWAAWPRRKWSQAEEAAS